MRERYKNLFAHLDWHPLGQSQYGLPQHPTQMRRTVRTPNKCKKSIEIESVKVNKRGIDGRKIDWSDNGSTGATYF